MGAYLPCRQHAPLLSLAPLRQQVIRALLAAMGLGVPSLPPGLSVRIETYFGPSLFAGSPGGCLGHPTSCSSPGALLPGFLFLGHAGMPPWPLSSLGALSLAPRPRRLERVRQLQGGGSTSYMCFPRPRVAARAGAGRVSCKQGQEFTQTQSALRICLVCWHSCLGTSSLGITVDRHERQGSPARREPQRACQFPWYLLPGWAPNGAIGHSPALPGALLGPFPWLSFSICHLPEAAVADFIRLFLVCPGPLALRLCSSIPTHPGVSRGSWSSLTPSWA